jgi:hypothetical protein
VTVLPNIAVEGMVEVFLCRLECAIRAELLSTAINMATSELCGWNFIYNGLKPFPY